MMCGRVFRNPNLTGAAVTEERVPTGYGIGPYLVMGTRLDVVNNCTDRAYMIGEERARNVMRVLRSDLPYDKKIEYMKAVERRIGEMLENKTVEKVVL